jgi:hypothetical protein
MTAFLWAQMGAAILTILVRALLLSTAKYPRTQEHKAWSDTVSLVENVGWVIWIAILLATR